MCEDACRHSSTRDDVMSIYSEKPPNISRDTSRRDFQLISPVQSSVALDITREDGPKSLEKKHVLVGRYHTVPTSVQASGVSKLSPPVCGSGEEYHCQSLPTTATTATTTITADHCHHCHHCRPLLSLPTTAIEDPYALEGHLPKSFRGVPESVRSAAHL